MVRIHPEEPFQECGAVLWTASAIAAETAEPISSLRSSTAEHSVDNRKTVERHHAEGPFYSLDGSDR